MRGDCTGQQWQPLIDGSSSAPSCTLPRCLQVPPQSTTNWKMVEGLPSLCGATMHIWYRACWEQLQVWHWLA